MIPSEISDSDDVATMVSELQLTTIVRLFFSYTDKKYNARLGLVQALAPLDNYEYKKSFHWFELIDVLDTDDQGL